MATSRQVLLERLWGITGGAPPVPDTEMAAYQGRSFRAVESSIANMRGRLSRREGTAVRLRVLVDMLIWIERLSIEIQLPLAVRHGDFVASVPPSPYTENPPLDLFGIAEPIVLGGRLPGELVLLGPSCPRCGGGFNYTIDESGAQRAAMSDWRRVALSRYGGTVGPQRLVVCWSCLDAAPSACDECQMAHRDTDCHFTDLETLNNLIARRLCTSCTQVVISVAEIQPLKYKFKELRGMRMKTTPWLQ